MSQSDTSTIPSLSLHQPWATAIALELKRIETRSWRPPPKYCGQRIAIHAAKRRVRRDEVSDVVLKALADHELPLGAVVATARLQCAHEVAFNGSGLSYLHPGVWQDCPHWRKEESMMVRPDSYGDFSTGRWLWFLDDIRRLPKAIPAVGRQGFWHQPLPLGATSNP